jgi:hypothetical protein
MNNGFDDNNVDKAFDDLVEAFDFDESIVEERELLLAQAAALRAVADAKEAEARALDKTDEERDCHILPDHFVLDNDGIAFVAPSSEREKMREMIPGLRAEALGGAQMRLKMSEALEEQEIPDEAREMVLGMLDDMANCIPDTAVVAVVEESLSKTVLSSHEVRAWRSLFRGMKNRSEKTIAIASQIEDAEIPEEMLNRVQSDITELDALIGKFDLILQTHS